MTQKVLLGKLGFFFPPILKTWCSHQKDRVVAHGGGYKFPTVLKDTSVLIYS